ncbi:hypothetical protein [Sulfobacillus harzensis]|uniref:Amidase domain-containing protein n=1 Tax=Sulfobacillus harzensis TaxID=2729629 RepID=A0A7Y0Q2S8_9FIRM|nr:hypothetical protein [Sulfobacillus harzensis]NMP22847.1 hypothetical protein [Sulfobacillus harzensis]
MRRHALSAVLLAMLGGCLAFLGAGHPVCPGFAIDFADTHWNWAQASGQPALVVSQQNTTRIAARVPSQGWFQPAYQCAEFVGRSLAAAGIPVPLVPESNPRWPVLVNVDRLSYYLLSRGYAHWIPLSRLRPGDPVLFRYPNPGHAPSPTVWSHMAIVVHSHPVLLDAHNAAHYHIRLRTLRGNAFHVRALAIRPKAKAVFDPPFRHGEEVEIAWRDLWTTRGAHLYWGQIFRVAATGPHGVRLSGVPGSVPGLALAPTAATPSLVVHHHLAVVLGMGPGGRTLIGGRFSPIPGWTRTPRIESQPGIPEKWHRVAPTTVAISKSGPLEPIPGWAAIPKAWAPSSALTVVDAEVTVNHRHWAQVEWRGARQGLGYLPWRWLKPLPSVAPQHLRHPLKLRAPDGTIVTVAPSTRLVKQYRDYWYGGALLVPQ